MANHRQSQDNLLELVASVDELAQLRRVLNLIFPSSYIELYHCQSKYSCGLFSVRLASQSVSGDKCEASSEPCTRTQLINLTRQFESCLTDNRAKPIGLCPVRRAIYEQCFDELIRQVTVGCIEQGLLLYRIRNELKMTINYYRRAYESAVAYGASKAIDATLCLDKYRKSEAELEGGSSPRRCSVKNGHDSESDEGTEFDKDEEQSNAANRVREYYQLELAKKDRIIKRQRGIIEALSQKSIDDIKSPI